jgi:hypothetical protein
MNFARAAGLISHDTQVSRTSENPLYGSGVTRWFLELLKSQLYASGAAPICINGPVLRRGVMGVSSSTSGSL